MSAVCYSYSNYFHMMLLYINMNHCVLVSGLLLTTDLLFCRESIPQLASRGMYVSDTSVTAHLLILFTSHCAFAQHFYFL